jgi:hypothetical protein
MTGLGTAYTPTTASPTPTDVTQPPAASGSSSGGGGAVTIVSGGDVTEGATSAPRTGSPDQADTTVMGLLRAIFQQTLTALTPLGEIAGDLDAMVTGIVGRVGGYATFLKDTAAVTIGTYAPGNAVGAKRTLANALRSPLTGVLNSVTLVDRSNSKAAMTLFIFDADPSGATINDKAAFAFGVNDLNVIAQIPIGAGDYVTTNSKAVAQLSGLGIVLKGAATTLYAALVTTGAPVFAATTDVQLGLGILQD